MKIGIITTLDHNIGDDFIRKGIINLLEEKYKGSKLNYVLINKHLPFTIYPKWHPINSLSFLKKIKGGTRLKNLIDKYLIKIPFTKFNDCDLIIQSGAPVYWNDCYLCEWNIPIWQNVIDRLHKKIPVLNVAAGSCYPYEQQPAEISNNNDIEYITHISDICKITTTRDRLANTLLNSLGKTNTKIPCTAFLAFNAEATLDDDHFILVNYMKGGGHFDWKQEIDAAKWELIFKETVIEIKKTSKVAFICHNEAEKLLASDLNLGIDIFYPKNLDEYISIIRRCKFAINNRLHASVAMAGIGIPSIAIGTDTRLFMVDELSLPTYYVKEIKDSKQLIEKSLELLEKRFEYKNRLLTLKNEVKTKYIKLLNDVV